MNLYSNFDYLKDHSTINAEYLTRVQLLEAQIEQLKQYRNPKKKIKALRLLAVYESFLDSIYPKLQNRSI